MFAFLIWSLFTLFISTINGLTVGSVWKFKNKLTKWLQFIVWSGRIMAVMGFFMVLLIVVVLVMAKFAVFEFIALAFFHITLTPVMVQVLVDSIFNLSYLLIVFPIIGLGIGITIHSWMTYNKDRRMLSGGIAAYNTGATIYNIFNAVRFVPKAFKALYESFGKSKLYGMPVWMWFALLAFPITISLGGAILITNWIMKIAEDKFPDMEKEYLGS